MKMARRWDRLIEKKSVNCGRILAVRLSETATRLAEKKITDRKVRN